jgi:ADP-ribose pyrophosphatase YjhB (NUDIX family)
METRVRVAALIVHEGRVLLVSAKTSPDHLVPPGGGLEAGETLAQAVEREVREEAGLEVEAADLVAYGEITRDGVTQLELYLAAHPQRPPSLAAGVSAEDRQVRWVALSGLPTTLHFPVQLAELCERVQAQTVGPLYLGCRNPEH